MTEENVREWEKIFLYHAKMTMAAQKNPYGSVEQVFPLALNRFAGGRQARYLGVKNVPQIPGELIERLADGGYELHTLDKAASGGRAVDMQLVNPLTGHPMTGSSSGTAMNVFLHFNDLGIGTDGGGSVLAPAMSLNLYGFISPLLCAEQMHRYEKRSTDGISFYPSLGLIARSYEELRRGIGAAWGSRADGVRTDSIRPEEKKDLQVLRIEEGSLTDRAGTVLAEAPERSGGRKELIAFLSDWLPRCDYLISREGPVDVNGIGDSVFGHFDAGTAASQKKSGKGLIRVANMAGATALCIPETALGCGRVLLCESVPEKIAAMLAEAASYPEHQDDLTEWYFGNLEQYLTAGAFMPSMK